MTRLKKMLAEIQKLPEGGYLDTDTGEILDKNPEEKTDDEKLQNILFQDAHNAASDFKDNKYINSWGKVSPLNIIVCDNINSLYGMDPKSAGDAIINIIEGLNNTYGANDKTYDYISKEYLNKIKFNLSKMKSIDKIVEYITNMYFAGLGMSNNKKKYASINNMFNVDMEDKELLQKIIIGLNAIINCK